MSVSQNKSLTPRTPRPKSPRLQLKLRSSCDTCGQAKIKCDRGQPACGRCVVHGVACVYGVSRKAGKPPRRRPAVSTFPSHISFARDPRIENVNQINGGSRDIDIMLSLAQGDMSAHSPFFTSNAAFQAWFPFDSLGRLNADAITPISSDRDTYMSRQSNSRVSQGQGSTTDTATRPYCTLESKDLMRRLCYASPSDSAPNGFTSHTLNLDFVLARNRDVAGRLELLLKCPCARSPHTAMLYASIVSRILLWYQQAISNTTCPGMPLLSPTFTAQEPLPWSLSTPTTFHPLDSGTADDSRGVLVLPTPITVGNFQSGDQGLQTTLKNCIALSELRTVSSLIDSFISLGTSSAGSHIAHYACPAAGEFSSTLGDTNLFASLGAWLRTEHRRVVSSARSGLSELDENLSFWHTGKP
ncbi:hypothetical protein QQS21_000690 [Conoideocrella luteorostrata]|uniref:Zn(2)-C6 fungal-type domain-containing protein n=1 Tax=Conoideocrella luteorostrata TaxID=1105319 RepID=A0AAJ0G3X4_9HYPO|nr:hypothetical protein QQS21_000690 [Conoideocrella luteorostrata]